MRRLNISLFGLAAAILASGFAGAETYPASAPVPETFEAEALRINRVPPVNPLRISTADVAWDGNGAVDIGFSMNQRAMVWVAIYEIGSNETGATSLFGAVQRLQPQDKFVAIAPNPAGASLEAGNNSIRWDGNDWEGNAVGPGSYEFDVIGFNILDEATLVAPTNYGDFDDTILDLRTNEIWGMQEERFNSNTGESPRNSIFRANLGTDFLGNPTAWETWDANNVYNELNNVEPNSRGGLYPDPSSDDIFFISESSWNENSGVIKMRANRAAQAFEPVTDFGTNGLAATPGPAENENAMQVAIWNNMLISPSWSSTDPPAGKLNFWDKETGEWLMSWDHIREFFFRIRLDDNNNETISGGGPSGVVADESGLWVAGWRSTNVIKLDWDGNLIWVNGPGDVYADQISAEVASARGIGGDVGTNGAQNGIVIRIQPDLSGNIAVYSPRHNHLGSAYEVLGRDGTGLFRMFADSKNFAPMRPALNTGCAVIQNDLSRVTGEPYPGPNAGSPGPWDGMYWDAAGWKILTNDLGADIEAGSPGYRLGMLVHVPFDLQTARLGAVTAVEAVESAGTPDSYALGAAYPNPFNPETAIDFAVPAYGHVRIDVYNAAGQEVSSLVDRELGAGTYKATWDALDRYGEQVSSGVYFYRMVSGDFSATHSMTLLK